MKSIVIINKTIPEHLENVINEMKVKGAPTLKGFVCEDCIYLAEGSHRAVAAMKLGLTIKIEDISEIVDLYENPETLLSEIFEHDLDYDFEVIKLLEGKLIIDANSEIL
jgi:hypothetical protein